MVSENAMVNVKVSFFLRSYSEKLKLLERFKLYQIKKQMRRTARYKKIFYLWFKIHNILNNTEKLEKI